MRVRNTGKRFSSPRAHRRSSLTMQSLEQRSLMAADVGMAAGYLQIHGTEGNDVAEVYQADDCVVVNLSEYDADGNLVCSDQSTFAIADIKGIAFQGGDGDDTFVNETDLSSIAMGGAGDDMLLGGGGKDVFVGGAGNDTLLGGAGNDILMGGGGENALLDNSGADAPAEETATAEDTCPAEETPPAVETEPACNTTVEETPAIDDTAVAEDECEPAAEVANCVVLPPTADPVAAETGADASADCTVSDEPVSDAPVSDAPVEEEVTSVAEDANCDQPEPESIPIVATTTSVNVSVDSNTVVSCQQSEPEDEVVPPAVEDCDPVETTAEAEPTVEEPAAEAEGDSDLLVGGPGHDLIFGGEGDDLMFGDALPDELYAQVAWQQSSWLHSNVA